MAREWAVNNALLGCIRGRGTAGGSLATHHWNQH